MCSGGKYWLRIDIMARLILHLAYIHSVGVLLDTNYNPLLKKRQLLPVKMIYNTPYVECDFLVLNTTPARGILTKLADN